MGLKANSSESRPIQQVHICFSASVPTSQRHPKTPLTKLTISSSAAPAN